jgi:hypothetical protein
VVDATIVELNISALYRSILTFPGISSVQVICCVVPVSQFSPPFGAVTVKSLFIIVKLASDRSNIFPSSTLRIFT